MKTIQNNTLANFLIIGLLISFFTLNSSCNKIREYAQFGVYHFVNQTSHTITFYNQASPAQYEPFTILPNSVTVIEKHRDGGKVVDPLKYHNPLLGYIPPLLVKFNNVKCLEITPESEHTPLDLKNYVVEKLGERSYKFTYTFTEADYNRAIACP